MQNSKKSINFTTLIFCVDKGLEKKANFTVLLLKVLRVSILF
jgi:hypothetical protein